MSWKSNDRAENQQLNEKGTIRKIWGGRITVALIYPNSYFLGMSNLGFQQVYHLLNRRDDTLCERFFLPEPDKRNQRKSGGGGLLSTESRRPLKDFDILAFSLSFENDYLNILKILDMGNIPITSKDRCEHDPLVIAGGITTFINPEPVADFFDIILIGEAEELIDGFIEHYSKLIPKGRNKLLSDIPEMPGAYVPSAYSIKYLDNGTIGSYQPRGKAPERVKRVWSRTLAIPASSHILTPDTEFSDMHLVEISRGCPHRCRFCAIGFIYQPLRRVRPENIVSSLENIESPDRIGLVGAAVSDYPDINALCAPFLKDNIRVSISSMRADSASEGLINMLKQGGHKTLSIAPEAGTERMRKFINKGLTDSDIMNCVKMTVNGDILNMKLYFMIGLPSETLEDVEGIVLLVKRIKGLILDITKVKGRIGRITLSVNPFIPKPWTPFQWCSMDDAASLDMKLKIIKSGLRNEGNINIIHENIDNALIQGVLSRGDRRVAELITASFAKGGWKKGLRGISIDTDFYLKRERSSNEVFPWDFIDQGISKDDLWKDFRRAFTPTALPQENDSKADTAK